MRTPSTGNAAPPPDATPHPGTGAPVPGREASEGSAATRANVEGEAAPRLPHERDESSDSGTGAPSDLMRRAHDDAASGKPGTDKGEATDAVYGRNLRGRTPGAERD